MKLELKHLAPYLPYGLKMVNFNVGTLLKEPLISEVIPSNILNFIDGTTEYKPILVPLKDLENINSRRFAEFDYDIPNQVELCDLANKRMHYINLSVGTYELCLMEHIDIFGLIDAGLAVDINTLEK